MESQPKQNQQKIETQQKYEDNMIGNRVADILKKIDLAKQVSKVNVKLIAVSKTKTVQEILGAYKVGIRDFGQNYAEQIEEKQPKLPNDINWHFIGHLQSNKIKKILVPNLMYVQTVDRQSLAEKLEKAVSKQERSLNILIQIKSSQQQSKSGISPKQSFELFGFIKSKCPHLKCKGLMTIGKQGDQSAFKDMAELKKQYCQKYQIPENQFELSMGMSADFQAAIKYGSTAVRVGSSIFGPRNYPKKKAQQIA